MGNDPFSRYFTECNEFVVYDPKLITIKFLVKVKFTRSEIEGDSSELDSFEINGDEKYSDEDASDSDSYVTIEEEQEFL